LAGGSEPDIHFWYYLCIFIFLLKNKRDLRSFSLVNTFNETHSDEVTSLQFLKDRPSVLLSSSLDGIVCLFDLSKDNEEEAADTGIEFFNIILKTFSCEN